MSHRNRLQWTTPKRIEAAGLSLPVSASLRTSTRADAGTAPDLAGVRPNSSRQMLLKRLAWPVARASQAVRGHQYVHYILAKWLRSRLGPTTTFLEVGPGDMSFRRFLPADMAYNAIDFAVSEFQLRRVVARDPRVNLAIASVTDIPLPDACVDVVVAVEVLQHVGDIERGMAEIRRVMRPGGAFLVSVGNGESYKVERRGRNPYYVHFWNFAGFRELAERHGFRLVDSRQTGRWVPVPKWMSRESVHLPLSSSDERANCMFLYFFERGPDGPVAA